MAALDISRPGRVIRPRPVMLEVVVIAPGVEVILPPWGRDVQGLTGVEINPGRKDVDMDSVFGLIVSDGGPGIAIRLKAGPGQALKAVQHVVDLLVGWFVLRRPGDHRGRAPVFEVQRVDDLADELGIPAQHGHAGAFPALVICLIFEVLRGGAAGRAAAVEFNHHRMAPGLTSLARC